MAVLLQALYQTLVGAQTEIIFFIIALCAHVLLFGKYRVIQPRKTRNLKKASREGQRRPSDVEPILDIQAVKALVRQRSGRAAVAAELQGQLKESCTSKAHASQALAEVLEGDVKGVSATLLDASRDLISTAAVPLDARLAEALLRGYLGLGKLQDFEEALSLVEEAGQVGPSVAVLALRASLNSSDLERALKCLRKFAPMLKDGLIAAPSTAPQGPLQVLVRLAGQSDRLPALVRELRGCGLLTDASLEVILATCAKSQHRAALQDIEDYCRAEGLKLSAAAYGSLVRGARDPEKAVRLLDEATKVLGPEEQAPLLAAAEAALTQGHGVLAQSVLARLPTSPGPEVAMAALRLHTRAPRKKGEDATADGVLLWLFGKLAAGAAMLLAADGDAGKAVAEAALRRGRTDVLQQLMASQPVGARHVTLLKRLGEGGQEAARRVFDACPEKTACLYNTLLDVCIDCQDMQMAEKVMSEAISAGMADVVTYNTLIKKLLRCGELEKARAVIETMRTSGGDLMPNTVTFNEFIDAVVRDNATAAWQLVEEMQACGLKPTSITASIILKTVQKSTKAAEVDRCMSFVETLQDDMDEVLLSSVCEACIRADRPDLLQKPLRRQRSGKGVKVEGPHTFGSLIRAYGFVQDLAGAQQTWREMRGRQIVPTSITIGCMVEALACNGDPEAGYQLIKELLSADETRDLVNSVMYGSVLKGLSQQRSFARVWELYAEMVSQKLERSLVTYNALINICVRSGDSKRIPGLLEDMARDKIEPNLVTYSTVLKAYCYENRMDKAFEMLEELKRSGHYQPDEITYNIIIDGCARNCLYERGLSALKDMERNGVRPSAYTLSLLVKLAQRCDKVPKAFELCEQVSRKYRIHYNTHVYENLIAACTSTGATQRALGLFEEMLHAKVKPAARTYTLLLRCCLANYELQDAAGLLRAATGLSGAHPRTAGHGPAAYRLPGGPPTELISEVLEGIACHGGDEALAVQLFRDVKRALGSKVDMSLPRWLASKVARGA